MTAALTGRQKAAVVLAQAGTAGAARVLKAMSEQEAVEVLSAMATLPTLSPAEVREVFEELEALHANQSGIGVARELLTQRLGPARAEEILARFVAPANPHPLRFLERMDATQIVGAVAEEHPQTGAMVLSYLPADTSARVLGLMDAEQRIEVTRRIATMGRIAPEAVQHVADALEQQLAALLRAGAAVNTEVGGVPSVVAILNQTDRSSEKQILADLEGTDPQLAEEIRNQLFVFDDIVTLDDRTLQLVMRNVVPKDLAVALKNASPELRQIFQRNMSERAAQDLAEEIELLGPTRLSQVEAAQSAVVKIVRQLEASGEIVLARGDDELV